jgi:hypothetical protein
MDKNTNSVTKGNSVTVHRMQRVQFDFGLGKITTGPFLPILSGNKHDSIELTVERTPRIKPETRL